MPLPEVDRGRCEFRNIHAVVLSINESGMYKLGTTNQFDPLPTPLMSMNEVNKDVEIPLRTAAHKASQGGGQGFVKCGCNKTCQANNCKCKKAKQLCNSRCHKGLFIYKVWILSVIGGPMNRVIFLLAAADTFLC